MNFLNSIKSKLIFLMLVIGISPLIIMTAYTSYSAINEAFEASEEELAVQNDLITQEVSSMMTNNFISLRLLAVNHAVQEYLIATPENRNANMKNTVQNANALFKDASNIILTDNSGQQLVRSDNSKLVSTQGRAYFDEAMKGNETVSELVVSKTDKP